MYFMFHTVLTQLCSIKISVLLCLFLNVYFGFCENYTNYRIYSIDPKNGYQSKIAKDLLDFNGIEEFNRFRRHATSHIIVSPKMQPIVEAIFRESNMSYSLVNDNMQRMLDDIKLQEQNTQLSTQSECNPMNPGRRFAPKQPRISFSHYERYDTIQMYLDYIANTYSDIVELLNIGQSYEGRNLTLVHLSLTKEDLNKPAIVIDAGIHAREWIAPAFALYIINQLTEHSNQYRNLLEQIDWYIVPLINPDGYEYSHTHDRFWRKTRTKHAHSNCLGVDANRNWDFHWEADTNPCKGTYTGPYPFSEPESAALRDVGLLLGSRIKLYVSLHSYGPMILYPWGYINAPAPNNDELKKVAEAVAKHLHYTEYETGVSARVLYVAPGGSDDWFLAKAGAQLAYTWELPGGGQSGFDLPEKEILAVCEDSWNGMLVFANYIANKYGIKIQQRMSTVHRFGPIYDPYVRYVNNY